MQYRINTDQKKIIGRRPNLSGKNMVADEIVSVLSLPPEEMPLPPLSALPPTTPRAPRKRNPQGFAIAATALLFAPLLYPFALFAFGILLEMPLPLYYYPLLVFIEFWLSIVGGFFLYLAARAANYLRLVIGFLALVIVAVPSFSLLFYGASFTNIISENIDSLFEIGRLICCALIFLCMLALCVFDILLLMRVFRKEKQSPAE